MAGRGFEQCYDAQAAVAADSLLVVAFDVSQDLTTTGVRDAGQHDGGQPAERDVAAVQAAADPDAGLGRRSAGDLDRPDTLLADAR